MKKLIILISLSVLITSVGCNSNRSAVDKRIQKLEKKKRKNPDDCPKIDC